MQTTYQNPTPTPRATRGGLAGAARISSRGRLSRIVRGFTGFCLAGFHPSFLSQPPRMRVVTCPIGRRASIFLADLLCVAVLFGLLFGSLWLSELTNLVPIAEASSDG